MDKIRPETMDERLQRLVYEYDSPAGMKKPVHMNNKNIITYENYKQPPKKYDAMDRSTYPSDPDQYQRLIQTNPKSYLNKTEALMKEWCDLIGFASQRVAVQEQDVGFKKKARRGIAVGERMLHVVEQPAFVAKNRFKLTNSGPLEWGALMQAIKTSGEQDA